MNSNKTLLILAISYLLIGLPSFAQQKSAEPGTVLTDQVKEELISRLASTLRTKYVFEAKADSTADAMEANYKSGASRDRIADHYLLSSRRVCNTAFTIYAI